MAAGMRIGPSRWENFRSRLSWVNFFFLGVSDSVPPLPPPRVPDAQADLIRRGTYSVPSRDDLPLTLGNYGPRPDVDWL